MNTILAFDIGGTKTAILEGTRQAEVLQRRRIPTRAQDPFDVTFDRLCAEGDAVLAGARAESRVVDAVSVSIGGPLDIARGIIQSPPHLPNWVDAPLKDRLRERFGLPVHVEHDGNAGALAEARFGAGRGARNLIFLTAGTGLGGGIILDGRIYRGTTDTAGEVGHVRLADDGPVEYGKAGSWEGFCSGAGMLQLAHRLRPGRWPQTLTTHELLTQAQDGDADAQSVVRASGEWLGRGLAMLVDTLNPEVIVLGSLAAALGDLLLEPARQVVRAEALPKPAAACRIVPAELGARLGDVAALMAAIDAGDGPGDGAGGGPGEAPAEGPLAAALRDSCEVQAALAGIAGPIQASGRAIVDALLAGRMVIVFGNGGSALQAQHLAEELVGKYGPVRRPLPSIALTADSGVVTCIANDFGYDQLFARQVEAFTRPGDVVIGITTSGKSANVLAGLAVGRARGGVTIAMTGAAGLIGGQADHVVAVPSPRTSRVQEAHAFIAHYWCEMVDERM